MKYSIKKFRFLHLRVPFLLSLAFLLCFSIYAQESSNKDMLWKVSSEDGIEGYLAGSIHMVEPDFYPLDSIFQNTFSKADKAVFELNSDKAKSQILSSMHLALYSNGEKLEDNIPKKLYKKTEKELKKIGFPTYEVLKPWFAGFLIKAWQIQESGATEPGIDDYFFNKAKEEKKPIIALETTEQQMKFFASMNEDLQIEFLEYIVKNLDKNSGGDNKTSVYWKSGNIEALSNYLNDENASHLGNFSEKLTKRLIQERNENWRKQLIKLFKQDEIPFIVVGVGHLVGNNNLINMLKKDGYTIEQL